MKAESVSMGRRALRPDIQSHNQVRPIIMKRFAVGTVLLSCLLAGCEVSVTPSKSERSPDTSTSEMRNRVVKAMNTFETQMGSLRSASKGYVTNRNAASEGLRIASEINPYSPPGVDPELAAAIRRVKDAEMALFEVDLNSFAGGRLPWEEEKAVSKACDDYNEVRNRMIIKYNIRSK